MIHHVALEVRRDDVGESERFWELLGFARVDLPPSLAGRAVWLERGGTQVHLMYADDPVAPPSGHVAVVADDYERTLDRLRAAGHDPEPRAQHWGAPRCFVRCPAGHRVEVMSAPPG
ncbi:MAG TPA: VOC family protein [Solirubrobacteraceae bacterium]|nr:VOC family protein [Solirubrobacteraceae bacterium]